LRGDASLFEARVSGDETNLIDADSVGSRESGLQLLRQFSGLGFSGGKGVGETAEFLLGNGVEELNAGKPSGRQQLRKLLFRQRPFQGHAIQQKLGAGGSQKESTIRAQRHGSAQLFISDFQLFGGADVLVAVKAGKLQEDVEASDKSPPRRCFWIDFHAAPLPPGTRTPSLVR